MTDILLQLAAALAVATCNVADAGVPHADAFERVIAANIEVITSHARTPRELTFLARSTRMMAEDYCPHNFNQPWI